MDSRARRLALVRSGGPIVGAAGLATVTCMVGAALFRPAWPGWLRLKLGIAQPVPDVSAAWWDQVMQPAPSLQEAALRTLGDAVAWLSAGALLLAAFAIVLHTISMVLARWHELTVRCALGARLRHLAVLVGGGLLRQALAGAAAGALGGGVLLVVLHAWWPSLLTRAAITLPAVAGAAIAAAGIVVLLVLAQAPLLISLTRRVRAVADLQGEHATTRGPLLIAQNLLVVLQLAGLLIVVYGGGLIVKSSTLLEPDRAVPYSDSSTIAPLTFDAVVPSTAQRVAAYRAALERATHGDTPLIAIASPGTWQGLGRSGGLLAFGSFSGYGGGFQPMAQGTVRVVSVSPGALGFMAVRIINGREFTPTDTSGARRAVILSDVAARQMFGRWRGIVGTTIRTSTLPGNDYLVVGIARTPAPPGLGAGGNALPMAYFSLLQHPPARAEVVAREGGRSRLAQAGWSAALASVGLRLGDGERLDARLRAAQHPVAWFAALVLCLTVLAVLLALYALAALMTRSVTQRRREIAIRLALGARAHHIVRWTLVRAVLITTFGVGLGAGAAGQLRQFLRAHVRGTAGGDLTLLFQVLVLFAGITLIASLMPIRKALAVDPAAAWTDRES